MSRTPTPKLDRVFTYAESSYATDEPDLVFASLKGDVNIWSEATMLKIANDPLTRETLGIPFLILRSDSNLLATRNFEHLIELIDTSGTQDRIVWVTKNGTDVIQPASIFDNCGLPHKYVLGCKECLTDKETKNHCLPKKAVLYYEYDENVTDLDDLSKWQHRKLGISDFTYISPMLTAPENIAKKNRTISEHDFSYVGERSKIRSDAMKERHRRERFKKNECSRCLGQTQCHTYQSWKYVHCEGPYVYTEEEAIERILESVTIPYSNAQLRYLINNMGPLRKRYNRCKYVTTFSLDTPYDSTLRFGFDRVTTTNGCPQPFATYKEAETFIKTYGYDRKDWPKNSWRIPVTKKLKALLCLLAQYSHTPQMPRGFSGYQTYPAIYIERTWEGLKQHYVQARGRYDWFTRSLSRVADIMRYDSTIPYLNRTPSKEKPRWSY